MSDKPESQSQEETSPGVKKRPPSFDEIMQSVEQKQSQPPPPPATHV